MATISNIQKQAANPMLQRETAQSMVTSTVGEILSVLTSANNGDLVRQSNLFDQMEEIDAHLYAEMQKRKSAVAGLDWSLTTSKTASAKDKKTVAMVEEKIRDYLDDSTLIYDMCNGIGHGFSCLELEWIKGDDGFWMPKAYARPNRWFTLDKATRTQIRLRDQSSSDGVELVQNGWLVHLHSSKTGYPSTQAYLESWLCHTS